MPDNDVNTNTNTNVAPVVNTDPVLNYEVLIANARKDEKDKLYPQIETYKTENAKLVTRTNELLISTATKDEKIVALEAEVVALKANVEELKVEGEKNVSKDKTVQDLQLEIQKLQDQLTLSANEVTKVRTEYELKDFRSTKLKDLDESVHELVSGSTQEEIEASVAKAKATYEKIASKFSANPPANNVPAFNTIPPVNMQTANNQFKQVTADDISNMSMADYAVWRKQQGLK